MNNYEEQLKDELKIIDKDNRALQQENIYLREKCKQLQTTVNEVREYINNNSLYEEIYDYNTDDEQELQYVSDETATNDLLNILQGVDKE